MHAPPPNLRILAYLRTRLTFRNFDSRGVGGSFGKSFSSHRGTLWFLRNFHISSYGCQGEMLEISPDPAVLVATDVAARGLIDAGSGPHDKDCI